ncbi:TIGR04104 family putative zinc finger protein [Planococcus salinus]|uniref:Cxxc_20_cxxc protein n=1 Tax=Planococcus salinus TaxID=1848460 RepID=A0A3M8PB23_9BACL|nr:TIGR04104 family putative zinc finger protein [Planococcus salinus]RNF40908.1 hypothetical protein EEX84_00715 [Planococcus salinus]
MPTCNSCGRTWSWKEAMKSSFSLDPAMKCPKCGKRQHLTKKSRKRMIWFNWLVLIPLALNIFLDLSVFFVLFLMLVLFAVSISLMPFHMELTEEEEPLW